MREGGRGLEQGSAVALRRIVLRCVTSRRGKRRLSVFASNFAAAVFVVSIFIEYIGCRLGFAIFQQAVQEGVSCETRAVYKRGAS